MTRTHLYNLCTAVILVGFAMLIQPFSMSAFSFGLPVMLVGIVLHIVLDHLPAEDAQAGDNQSEGAGR